MIQQEQNKYQKYKSSYKRYYQNNKERLIEYARKRNQNPKIIEYRKEYARQKRIECLNHYGNKCVCCGETEPKFLSFDHINGGGTKHRNIIRRNITEWLVKNNFPTGFQILCHNCNQAKGFYGICPHQAK